MANDVTVSGRPVGGGRSTPSPVAPLGGAPLSLASPPWLECAAAAPVVGGAAAALAGEVRYRWRSVGGPTLAFDISAHTGSRLTLAAHTLQAGQTYTLEVAAWLSAMPAVNNTARATINSHTARTLDAVRNPCRRSCFFRRLTQLGCCFGLRRCNFSFKLECLSLRFCRSNF